MLTGFADAEAFQTILCLNLKQKLSEESFTGLIQIRRAKVIVESENEIASLEGHRQMKDALVAFILLPFNEAFTFQISKALRNASFSLPQIFGQSLSRIGIPVATCQVSQNFQMNKLQRLLLRKATHCGAMNSRQSVNPKGSSRHRIDSIVSKLS